MRMKNIRTLFCLAKVIIRHGKQCLNYSDTTGMMRQEYILQAVKKMFRKYRDILTVKELCDVLCVSKNTAYKLLKSGEIKSVRIGKVYKIPKKMLSNI